MLLHGTADVALGVDRDLQRIVLALRAKFPHVLIHLRADSGYAKTWLYDACERLGVEYSIGSAMYPPIKRNREDLLGTAIE